MPLSGSPDLPPPTDPKPGQLMLTLAILAVLGVLSSALAYFAGLPMPFLLGSLFASASYTLVMTSRGHAPPKMPRGFRMFFVGLIGVMIGATFSPELISALPLLWLSLCAVLVFVLVNQALGYLLFRQIGGYDKATALFCAMPGGLIEAITLGEAAGGDLRVLTVQHFARVILVVVCVPIIFFVLSGEAVGSSAGQTFGPVDWNWLDLAVIVALAPIGIALAGVLRLPAGQLIGPLILSAALHGFGWTEAQGPEWLLYLAQLVVGVGLGTQFSGASLALLLRCFGMGLLSVAMMLAIGAVFAVTLSAALPIDFDALFISFAPGGVTEMGLIALSLGVSPVIVATHHLARIVLTVVVIGYVARAMGLKTR